jgi:hypothetical protein
MRFRALFALIVVASWALASSSAGSAAVAGHFCVALDTPSTFADPALTAQRNSYVVLQAWEAERAAQLKAANPSLMVLVYQNLSAMAQGTGQGGLGSSGVNYAEANTAHPEWFLADAGGNRIAEEGYGWLWMADVGAAGYQRQWTANVIRLLRAGPWDGVMMDDTNTTARYHVDPSRIAKYPTDAAYQAAVRSMLAYAGPAIQAAGKLAIPNMGSWSEYPEVVKEWLQYVSGGMDEMFLKWSTTPGVGYRGAGEWETQVGEIATAEAMGKRFLAITQAEPGDTQAVRYGWASTLLAANGHTAFLAGDGYTGETWSSEYEVPLGEPTSTATAIGDGAWRRSFANGLVVVNPTSSTLGVSLGGSYSGSGLTDATEASLGPHSAVILTGSANGGEAPTGGSQGSGSIGSGGGGAEPPPSPTPTKPSTTKPLRVHHGHHRSRRTEARATAARLRHARAARRGGHRHRSSRSARSRGR